MLRRLWAALAGPSLRREGGGQHTEAGVLMAGLVLVGGAMVMAAPAVGDATANFWKCEIQGSGSTECGGDASASRRSTLEKEGIVPVDDADSSTDSAASHEPGTITPVDQRTAGTWGTPDGDVQMVRCDLWAPNTYLCTAPDGRVWDCYYGYCRDTTIPTYPMTCSNEGTSPETRLCRTKNGGIYHCTNTTDKDNLSCRNTNNDSDAEMPDDAVPVACGDDNSAEGSVTCIGSNGTLYQCPHDAAYGSDCKGGGRNINREDTSLSDCVAVPQYGEDAVQCTYTSTDLECPPDSPQGCELPRRQTSVLCHDDPPGTPNGAYQHCQDLGRLVDPGDKVEGLCLDPPADTPAGDGVCDAAADVVLTDDLPTGQGEPVDFGAFTFSLPADQTTDVRLPDGTTRQMTQEELTRWCETDAAACETEMNRQHDDAARQLYDVFQQAGICSTDAQCQQVIAGDTSGQGRRLLETGLQKFAVNALAATLGAGALAAAVTLPSVGQKLGAGIPLALASGLSLYLVNIMRSVATTQGRADMRAATIAGAQWAAGLAQQLAAALRSGEEVAELQALAEAAEEGESLIAVTVLEEMEMAIMNP